MCTVGTRSCADLSSGLKVNEENLMIDRSHPAASGATLTRIAAVDRAVNRRGSTPKRTIWRLFEQVT